MRPIAWALFGIWGAAISMGAGACRSYNTWCTDQEDCLGGNEADIEACEVALNYEEDVAVRHGCGEFWDALQDCLEAEASCEGSGDAKYWGIDGDSCEEESLDYANCKGS